LIIHTLWRVQIKKFHILHSHFLPLRSKHFLWAEMDGHMQDYLMTVQERSLWLDVGLRDCLEVVRPWGSCFISWTMRISLHVSWTTRLIREMVTINQRMSAVSLFLTVFLWKN
jgi:hypothetical protein